MQIGIPKEVKPLEGRVALTPEAAGELCRAGHRVFIQRTAGEASGYPDTSYSDLGVEVLEDAAAVYGAAELVVKVKEPQPEEWPLLRRDHLLFCYLHLAAEPALTEALRETGLTAVAFETVSAGGKLPLLAPMSDIAGRLAVQIGANLLLRPNGGPGLLLGGLAAVDRGHVVVVGAGAAGTGAVRMAAGMGARVTVLDIDRDRLEAMRDLGANVNALHSNHSTLASTAAEADLLIGAVLIPGASAPKLITEEMVASMAPGSVLMDIAIDQGGCAATARPTTYEAPTYRTQGVTHFCVTNMPGAVPRSASQALSAAITPYALKLAAGDWEGDPALQAGLNLRDGKVLLDALK